MLHIALAMTDPHGTYAKFVGAAMLSIFANTKENVSVHLLHDNTLTHENSKKLFTIANDFCQNLILYNVESLQAERLHKAVENIPRLLKLRYTLAAMYRLLLPELLPKEIDKIIYIDTDIICHLDIKELWNYPCKHTIAAAGDKAIQMLGTPFDTPKERFADNYFNSGVLVLNLTRIRKQKITLWDDGIDFLKETGIIFMTDQDILNHFFKYDYDLLPEKYNKIVKLELIHRFDKDNGYMPAIYHFADHMLTFLWKYDKYSRLFWYYFLHTPFFDVNFVGRFLEKLRVKYTDILCMMIRLCAARERIFISREEVKKQISDILERKDNELFITIHKGNLNINIDDIKGKLLLIFLPEYNIVKKMLMAYGLKENEDFIDGRMLIRDYSAVEDDISTYLIEKRIFDYDILANS